MYTACCVCHIRKGALETLETEVQIVGTVWEMGTKPCSLKKQQVLLINKSSFQVLDVWFN